LYYQMLQEEIVEKQAARRRARQAAQAPWICAAMNLRQAT
jgi:hypothetical protein